MNSIVSSKSEQSPGRRPLPGSMPPLRPRPTKGLGFPKPRATGSNPCARNSLAANPRDSRFSALMPPSPAVDRSQDQVGLQSHGRYRGTQQAADSHHRQHGRRFLNWGYRFGGPRQPIGPGESSVKLPVHGMFKPRGKPRYDLRRSLDCLPHRLEVAGRCVGHARRKPVKAIRDHWPGTNYESKTEMNTFRSDVINTLEVLRPVCRHSALNGAVSTLTLSARCPSVSRARELATH